MNHLLLFENYNNSTDNYQRLSFNRSEFDVTFPKTIINPKAVNQTGGDDLVNLGLLDGTIPVEDYWVEEITIEYNIQPVFSRYGIEEIEINLKKVYITGNYEIASGEDDIESYDFDITDNGPFTNRVSISTGTLPLYPNSMELDLTSLDEFYPDQKANTIQYTFQIGS